MTFDDQRKKVGRRPITIVEVDLDFCQNTYGSAPCTAAVGTTGPQKCFNCFKSCQDVQNYDRGTKTYTFSTDESFRPLGVNILPCIKETSISPTVLVPEDFSISAAVTVTMQDFTHHDRGVDPYVSERTYDAESQGTFFGKLRSRNPYLNNRVMRVKTGYIDEDRQLYTNTRTYLIDRMEGPDADGVVRLIGKDPLRYTDDDKYQVPVVSKGILASDLAIDEASALPMSVGSGADYAASGIVRVDDELIQYTSILNDSLVGLTRGYQGTTPDAHSADAKVQQCVSYTNATPPDVITDLLLTYAKIDPAYITLSDWAADAALWLPSFTSTVILSDPTSVKDVIKEILQATGSTLWWDEEAAQIRWKTIIPFLIKADVTILNDTQNIIVDSPEVEDVEEGRVSRVSTYFKLKTPIDDPDRDKFLALAIQIDQDQESPNAYGTPQNLEILSRWTPSLVYADAIGNRYLYRRRTTPRQITLRVDARDMCKAGDLRDVVCSLMQDNDGSDANIRFMVVEAHEVEPGTTFEYKMIQVAPKGGKRASLFGNGSTPVWTSASDEDKKNYLYISDEHGFMSDGSLAPRIC